jgi:hypothetical protein
MRFSYENMMCPTSFRAAGLVAGALLAVAPAMARPAPVAALIVNGQVIATIPAGSSHLPPKGPKITKFNGTITGLNNPTGLIGEIEYYPDNCEEISPGTWVIVGKSPHHGVMQSVDSPGGLGGCSGTYTYGVAQYTWTKGKKATKDVFQANWQTPDGVFNIPYKFLLALVP